jgi:hypothetical protein
MLYTQESIRGFFKNLYNEKTQGEYRKKISNCLHYLIRHNKLKFIDPDTNKLYTYDRIEQINKTIGQLTWNAYDDFITKADEVYANHDLIPIVVQFLHPNLLPAIQKYCPIVFEKLLTQQSNVYRTMLYASESDNWDLMDLQYLIDIIFNGIPVSYDVYHNIRNNTRFNHKDRCVWTDTFVLIDINIYRNNDS